MELSAECTSIKQLSKVQAAFIRGTNSSNWENAQNKYPAFTTASMLEPLSKLKFTDLTLPDAFLRFCQRAVNSSIEN